MSVRVSLRDMLGLIRVDTLHSVHNVGFLVIRLIYMRKLSVWDFFSHTSHTSQVLVRSPGSRHSLMNIN